MTITLSARDKGPEKLMLRAGLDEVGWGALAGDLVSVVVVMREEDLHLLPSGVSDSKRVSARMRESLFTQLCATVYDKGMGVVHPWEIDKLGPKRALQESYKRALEELRCTPDLLIVDGTEEMNKVWCWTGKQLCEPKADFNHKEVSVASMIAKVYRDFGMVQAHHEVVKKYGISYGWDDNKGYGGSKHLDAIQKHGLMFGPDEDRYFHRKSYCKKLAVTCQVRQ